VRFADAVEALDRRTNYERTGRLTDPTIERIAALCEMLDNPQRIQPAIHVTGTNGKSTTALAITAILRAAGLSVGTYLSPHVDSIRERIRFDGEPVTEDDFVEGWRELAPFLDHFDGAGKQITWFEAATALAFLVFADKALDVAVLEVGMGGAWDATNVADARVAAITGIGGDHPQLGATTEAVAREKAGVVKAGAEVVAATQRPEAMAVLRARAAEVGATLATEPEDFELTRLDVAVGGQQVSLRIGGARYDDVFLPLHGRELARDAVLGAAAAKAFLGRAGLSEEVLADGLARLAVPGRVEVAARRPLVVLDGAHNPPAAEALAVAMRESFAWDRLRLVVSIMADKDAPGVLAPLLGLADEVVVTRNNSPRASDPEVLAAEVRARGLPVTIIPSVPDAVSAAITASEQSDAVLVSGSLYTVGDARPSLRSAPTG